jgi:hypothetical protein
MSYSSWSTALSNTCSPTTLFLLHRATTVLRWGQAGSNFAAQDRPSHRPKGLVDLWLPDTQGHLVLTTDPCHVEPNLNTFSWPIWVLGCPESSSQHCSVDHVRDWALRDNAAILHPTHWNWLEGFLVLPDFADFLLLRATNSPTHPIYEHWFFL